MNIKLKQGLLISLLSFSVGSVATYLMTYDQNDLQPISRDGLKKTDKVDHFNQIDEMHKKMQKRMDKFFGKSFGDSVFDIDPFTGSSFTTNDIRINRFEDDHYKYIEIEGAGVSEDSLQVEVSNGMVSISGEIDQSEENNDSNSMSKSRYISKFNQSFNVPVGVDESKVKIEPNGNKLVIKFTKK